MNKYKVLIFDLDDTLINNQENIRYAFKKMIENMGRNYNSADFNRWQEIDKNFWQDWQDGLIELPNHLKHETGKKSKEFLDWLRAQRVLIYYDNKISLEKAIELSDIYMEAMTEVVIPITGAYETLEYLYNTKEYYILIATNGPSIATKEKLNKINCLEFVEEVLSADMFGYMKPKKEFFEAIQERLNNYNNDEYLIIGDSLKSDVGFGKACGFDSCWLDNGSEELTVDYKPTMIIKKLINLKDIL